MLCLLIAIYLLLNTIVMQPHTSSPVKQLSDFTAGNMERKHNLGSPSVTLNSGIGGGHFSYDYAEDPNSVFHVAAGRHDNLPCRPQSLTQWIDCPKTPHSYVEFLTENLEKVPTADVLESIGSPVSVVRAIHGVTDIQREFLLCDAEKAISLGPDKYSLESDSEHANLDLSAYTVYSNNHEASASKRFLWPQDELPVNSFSSSEYESHAKKSHTFWTREPKAGSCKVLKLQPKEIISAPSFPSQTHQGVPRPRASGNDRERRLRIAEGIRALQELLPNSKERGLANALDDVIDHAKFLQLQIKDLSRSRLGGELTSNPLIFFEGYGHYSVQDQITNEPLEEMMGKLLETNPSAATQLLESKGLYMMSMEMVNGLRRVT